MNLRLVQLDALRGIAILMVMGFHYTARYQAIYGHPQHLDFYFPLGRYGVQLFFIISGFVIYLTLGKTKNWKDFVISRFSRLYPVYWVSVIITSGVIWTFSLPGREPSLFSMMVNMSMIQDWFSIPHVDGVYWTLSLELSFYLIMLFVFILDRLERIEVICIRWILFILLARGCEEYFSFQILPVIKILLILDYANLFIIGIMFYRRYVQKSHWGAIVIIFASLLLEFILHGYESGIICSLFAAMVNMAIFRNKIADIIFSAKPLIFIGSISYSLYLLHQNIGYVMLRYLYSLEVKPVAAIPIVYLIVLGLAVLLNLLIEVPAREGIRRAWKKKQVIGM